MSAPGEAIPATSGANNSFSNTRKRQIVLENLTVDAVSNGGIHVNDGCSGRNLLTGKEPSHGSRGNSVIGKPKDLLLIKKSLLSSGGSPQRKRLTSKREKSRWETILNILIKNLLLMAVLFWLGQQIRRLVDKPGHGIDTSFPVEVFEGRIAEVETLMKKVAKLTQVQLEAMDEGGRQALDKSEFLENEFRDLLARMENLDKSIGELSDAGFLSKKEFEVLLSELMESRSLVDSGKSLGLDEIRSYAREMIIKEIERHASDGLGWVDYALASGGGRVVKHSEPYIGKADKCFSTAKGRDGIHSNAVKMLKPSFGEPGECFPLQGESGFVEIRLRTGIIPDAVTLEHVAKSVAYDRSSAPKYCRIYGWFEYSEENPSSHVQKMALLKEFSYDLEKSNAQTFKIEIPTPGVINTIRLDFSSNHGNPSHTCIYRLRVHGHELGLSVPE